MADSTDSNAAVRGLFILVLVCASCAQTNQIMPAIQGEAFSGRKVVLPDASRGHVAVLIFGFTKASKEPTSAWAARIYSDFGQRESFEIYQLPVLEDVPRFIRGLVISSMKKSVHENMRDHFMPVLQHESELKQLVNYQAPDDAYLLLLDRAGTVVKQWHGPFNDSEFAKRRIYIEEQLAEQRR